MSIRATILWTATVLIFTVVGIVGSFGYSFWLLARSISPIPSALIEGLITYLNLMITLEVISLGIVWTTLGPIPSTAWAAARIATWQGN